MGNGTVQQENLWGGVRNDFSDEKLFRHIPLAMRMRPKKLSDVIGQEHLLGPKCFLPRMIRQDNFGNIILFGPPGCGKTSLAEVIANETNSQFVAINAVMSNVAELRRILQEARGADRSPILFIDEIHRFNRAQQDLLLPDVELGTIRLIGATTHTPAVYIISPLLSRSHLFQLEPIKEDVIRNYLLRALQDKTIGLGSSGCNLDNDVLDILAQSCDGDLRRALNHLETLVMGVATGTRITCSHLETFATERHVRYDRDESEHHATISAYIKSMRGCDPNAALYWLAKLLEGGEDPRFIARRLVIFASEDIGLADSRALPLATACYAACETIGMPECAINLGHVTVFMALAQKSNSTYLALNGAREEIRTHPMQSVPNYLRNQPKSMAKRLNTEPYLYAHDYPGNVTGQAYMVEPKIFYYPKASGDEIELNAPRKTIY
ncbi:MAG: replication-associated recombination protein A [Puniceicoccales bacterium]|jgi:putative ATPase|nr:replication-associated recombination protein A [Puniceicoccales bacterium]